MHSLRLMDNRDSQWQVMRVIQHSDSYQEVVMFHKLSFESAMKLVNFLNGGAAQFSPEMTRVIEMCKANSA